jgi:hypothetical protein
MGLIRRARRKNKSPTRLRSHAADGGGELACTVVTLQLVKPDPPVLT